MPVSLVTAPAVEPIDIDVAKLHCKVDDDEDDELFDGVLVPAARDRAELVTQRALITQTWDLILDGFPDDDYIEIPKPPLRTVTYVKYVDLAGVEQTLTPNTDYRVQAPAGPRARRGRVSLPFATVWPNALSQVGSVTVRFVAGYGATPQDIPPMLRAALLMDINAMHADRENVIEEGSKVHRIYWSYRSHGRQCLAA